MSDIATAKKHGTPASLPVYDLLRRYELQCATNAGLDSNSVLVMPPCDYVLLQKNFDSYAQGVVAKFGSEDWSYSVDLRGPRRSGCFLDVFVCFSEVQKAIGLLPSFVQNTYQLNPELKLVSMGISSPDHYCELVWLPAFDICFSIDSHPEVLCDKVQLGVAFLEHVACSVIELVVKDVSSGIAHEAKDGAEAAMGAFSAALFLQLVLVLFTEHGATPIFIQKLRELKVTEAQYARYRKEAKKTIIALHNQYNRAQQEARLALKRKQVDA